MDAINDEKKSLEQILADAADEIKAIMEEKKESAVKGKNRCWWNGEKCPFTDISGLIEAGHWCQGCAKVDWSRFVSLEKELASEKIFTKEDVEKARNKGKEEGRESIEEEIKNELRELIDRIAKIIK